LHLLRKLALHPRLSFNLSSEVRFQAETPLEASDELADLIRSQAGLVQGPPDLLQASIPDRVQVSLGPAQNRSHGRHAEALEEVQPEEEAVLGGKRPEERDEQLAEPVRDTRPLLLLDADFHLAVDRDSEQLLFADSPPLLTLREHSRKVCYFVQRERNPVLGPESLDGFVSGKFVSDKKSLQEHAFLSTPTRSGGRPPLAPDMSAVVPHQVDQNDRQEGGEGAPALPSAKDPVVVVDQLEECPGAKLLGLGLGQAAAPAQAEELALDQVKVGFEERSAADCGPTLIPGLIGAWGAFGFSA